MYKFLKIVSVILVALILLIVWAMQPPAKVAVTPAVSMPADFIWGVSSSGFQSEGGKIASNWDVHKTPEHAYGTSVDFRHRYREDVGLAKQLGANTYRIGINWARVEPEKGKFDVKEMAYYDDLILALKEAGIAPLITLDHFIYPKWVSDQGAWNNPETTKQFVAYSRMIAERYSKDVNLWITFNEAAFFIASEKSSRKLTIKQTLNVRDNIVSAHRQVYDVIHQLNSKAIVTSNIVWLGDHFGSTFLRWFTNWLFLDHIEDKCDVIAIDYYAANVGKLLKLGKHWQWPSEPPGIYRALKILKEQYPDKPLLIAEIGMSTENGKPRADGLTREDVLRDTVYWTQRAKADGVNIIGYMVWSLTDNYEWGSYTPRFGLYTVNVLTDPTLARIPTAAVPAYQEIIRNHGVAPSYLPVLPQ
ncbi:MAG: family 1 glycosylhydrolase [Pseudomonadota bacterium]